jgi:hypothetical protein
MKRLFYSILGISLLLLSCNSGTKTSQNSDTNAIEAEVAVPIAEPEPQTTVSSSGIPVKINAKEFMEKVHDYNNMTTWKYKETTLYCRFLCRLVPSLQKWILFWKKSQNNTK